MMDTIHEEKVEPSEREEEDSASRQIDKLMEDIKDKFHLSPVEKSPRKKDKIDASLLPAPLRLSSRRQRSSSTGNLKLTKELQAESKARTPSLSSLVEPKSSSLVRHGSQLRLDHETKTLYRSGPIALPSELSQKLQSSTEDILEKKRRRSHNSN